MERDQFKLLCKGMKAVYTQETFLPDADAFNIWFALLGDLEYKVLNAAIQKYMLTIQRLTSTVESGFVIPALEKRRQTPLEIRSFSYTNKHYWVFWGLISLCTSISVLYQENNWTQYI